MKLIGKVAFPPKYVKGRRLTTFYAQNYFLCGQEKNELVKIPLVSKQ